MITLKRGYKKYYPINIKKILMTDQRPSGSSGQRINPQRKAKENINYRENRPYRSPTTREDIDITRRSTVTSRTPPPKQKESKQSEENESDAEHTNITLGNIDKENHSTPKQTAENSEKSDEDSDDGDDLLSSRVDKDHTLNLKTPIKAEIVPQTEHKSDSVRSEEEEIQDEYPQIIQADNRSNSEF